MRILLVTKQLLEKRDGKVYCEFALSSTIRRFEMMGELFVCCYNYEGKSCQPVDCLTDLADTQLVITDCAVSSAKMEKWPGFLSVFFDAAEENPGLDIRLIP